MEKTTFPISFWNYRRFETLGVESVKDWADLGMTLPQSPVYIPDMHDKNKFIELLDACAERGMKVIVNDVRACATNASDDPEGYEKKFTEAYEDFGKHPATYGFYVGDEPVSDKAVADCITAHKIQIKVAPNLIPHLNFLPYHFQKDLTDGLPFTEWVKKFKNASELRMLSYDCYNQMSPGEDGVHLYYESLRNFIDAAKAANVLPWTTLLSVGHYDYRCPKEDDFRWQLSTAVASGMKGVLWFFVYATTLANYRVSPIDEFDERSETFEWLSRVNRIFQCEFGEFFATAEHKATYHIGRAFGGYELFNSDVSDLILDIDCEHGLDGVAGFFEKDGQKFIALVNNSFTKSGKFRVHVSRDIKVFQRLNWGGEWCNLKDQSWDACYYENENEIVGGDWLAPGQMKVYRYE